MAWPAGAGIHGTRLQTLPMPPAVTGELLRSLAGSDIVVLGLSAEGFTPAVRQLCLLAWYMHGEMPIVTTAAGQTDAAEAVTRYARDLGAAQRAGIAAEPDLPNAVEQALARRAETPGRRAPAYVDHLEIRGCHAGGTAGCGWPRARPGGGRAAAGDAGCRAARRSRRRKAAGMSSFSSTGRSRPSPARCWLQPMRVLSTPTRSPRTSSGSVTSLFCPADRTGSRLPANP